MTDIDYSEANVCQSRNINISCSVAFSGNIFPVIIWRKENGRNTTDGDEENLILFGTNALSTNAIRSSLVLATNSIYNGDRYACEVVTTKNNSFESRNRCQTITYSVNGKPKKIKTNLYSYEINLT